MRIPMDLAPNVVADMTPLVASSSNISLQLAGIVVLGVAAQFVAERIQFPSILLLLGLGIIAGPVTGWLDPDDLFGDILPPMVSLAVGIVLFEGGLGLKFRELRGVGRVMWSLVTVGSLITLVAGTFVANKAMDLPFGVALLLGSILVVSGPTVIGPLLRVIRPTKNVATVLEWEGIFIDPIGAMLAVIVFEAVVDGERGAPVGEIVLFLACGLAVGAAVAAVMVAVLSRFWIPDFLRSSLTLAMVVGSFTLANTLVDESGLLATIVLGIVLANQHRTRVADIAHFSENLRIPLISILFIVLAARLDLDAMKNLGWGTAALIAVLVLIARPLGVAISTFRSKLPWRERVAIAAVAPRGIVAASISSVFALGLAEADIAGSEVIVPATFAVIISTVVIYGVGGPVLYRRLGVTRPEPHGVLLIGGDEITRTIAASLHDAGAQVLVVAGNRDDHYRLRMADIPARRVDLLGDPEELLQYAGLKSALALTDNDEFNTMVSVHLASTFGPGNVYQVTSGSERRRDGSPDDGTWRTPPPRSSLVRGRWLFDLKLTHEELLQRLRAGWTVRSTNLTEQYTWAAVKERTDGKAMPLFVVHKSGALQVVTPETKAGLDAGRRVIILSPPDDSANEGNGASGGRKTDAAGANVA